MGEETIWLPQDQTAALFDRDKSVISHHLKNIFEEWICPKIQLLQNLQQLPPTAKATIRTTTTST